MFLLASLALASSLAHAEDAKPAAPTFTPLGQVYAQYAYDITEDHKGANSFDLTRAYIGTDADISKAIGARVLLDASHDAVDPVVHVFVKNAWLEARGFVPGVKARFGMVDTGYAPYVDGFTGRRYMGKSFADNSGMATTADLGVNAQGKHLDGLLSWHAAVVNGEGFKAIELTPGKTLTARVTVDPLVPKQGGLELPITGYVSEGVEPADSGVDGKLVYAGNIGFKYKKFIIFDGEYAGFSQGTLSGGGESVFLAAGAPKACNLVVRFDHFDPDADTKDDESTMIRAGVDRYFTDKVSLALLYERSWNASDPDATLAHGIYVKGQAGF